MSHKITRIRLMAHYGFTRRLPMLIVCDYWRWGSLAICE